jgi:UDP-N-acetylglucosamine 2-epimerase (non-hydrolysing)
MVIFGTRPEAIKLAPVIAALRGRPDVFETRVAVTAQHREMLDQVLECFGVEPDYDLDIMEHGQSLSDITSRVLCGVEPLLANERPDIVLVQGDTTTVFAAALAAFYQQIPVGHVEAGLRTDDKYNPFPEEINRRLASVLADLHFAPTPAARDRLLAEGVAAGRVFVTGNTVIDALLWVLQMPFQFKGDELGWLQGYGGRLVLVTAHRRENLGEPLRRICKALRALPEAFDDVAVVYALHRNPAVREVAREVLGGAPRVRLVEPPEYVTFVNLMKRATLVITDSGGLQEEAPSLGVPVLVVRETTERPEGVEAGCTRLVGTQTETIVAEASRLLRDPEAYQAMARVANPYGDGKAAGRICDALDAWLAA